MAVPYFINKETRVLISEAMVEINPFPPDFAFLKELYSSCFVVYCIGLG